MWHGVSSSEASRVDQHLGRPCSVHWPLCPLFCQRRLRRRLVCLLCTVQKEKNFFRSGMDCDTSNSLVHLLLLLPLFASLWSHLTNCMEANHTSSSNAYWTFKSWTTSSILIYATISSPRLWSYAVSLEVCHFSSLHAPRLYLLIKNNFSCSHN